MVPGLAEHGEDVGTDRGPHGRVERREGLVQQDDLGPDGQRPGEGDPLLLSAGELMRIAPAIPRQPDQLEELVDPAAAIGAPGQPEGDVAPDTEVREQRALLRDVPDAAPLAGNEATPGIVDEVLPDPDLDPSSGRSKPAMIRSNVVLPLPEEPRMAVKEPVGTDRSTPRRTGWGPNALATPAMRRSFMRITSVVDAASGALAGGAPSGPAGGRTSDRARSRARRQ